MTSKHFIEILAETIEKEIRKELSREISTQKSFNYCQINHHEIEKMQSWLNFNTTQYVRKPQSNHRLKISGRTQEKLFKAKTPVDHLALELFNRFGALLDSSFSQSELKKAWRKIARTHHPDFNQDKNSHQKFIDLKQAYLNLLALCS